MFKPKKENLEGIPTLEEQKRDILENFDFKTLAMIMSIPCKPEYEDDNFDRIIGWKPWKMFSKDGMKLYNEGELRYMAADLLDKVIKAVKGGSQKHYYIATGPFKVIYRWGILELDAVLDSWSWD